ncbi:hypothetical protein CHS0354_005256 [Potamilus streckersoni]|uniref:Uncharacterized protein n=1 Tax=Potamilus streckersoni TaxID=2493646 RepID=A0AAE0S351_9BIVA|nr:hypothetical protein CHS0354_005256 [Potamilus streckersoni]
MSTELTAGVVSLGVAVLVLMIIVGIIMMYYCRGTTACSFLERCFKRPTSALNNLADSSNSYQSHVHVDSFDDGGDYVDDIAKIQINQTQFGDPVVSTGKKSKIIITNNTDRAGCTYDRTRDLPKIYHKTTDHIQTQTSDSTYDRMHNQTSMYDVTYQTRSKFQDSMYNHTKGLNEAYDVSYQQDHAVFGANTYDRTKTTAGVGRR